MHTVIRNHIEAYLDGTLPPVVLREVESHLRQCPPCAAEVAETRQTHDWMQLLVPEQPMAPSPGFYARVAASIEAEQVRRGGWLAVLFPVFGRQLGFAMTMFVLLVSGFLLTVRQTEQPRADTADVIMEAPAIRREMPTLTSDAHSNREHVMRAIVTPVSVVEGD